MTSLRPSLARVAFLLPLFLLLSMASTFAQSFNLVPPLDVSNFPKVRAYYNASKADGTPIDGLDSASFEVKENGIQIKPNLVKQKCETTLEGPTLCIVLVLDKSNSMNEIPPGNTISRFDFVKNSAKDFVNGLDYKKKTSVAIVSFDGESYLEANFSQDKGYLNERIDKMRTGTVTRYEEALLDKRWGAFQLLTNQNCEPPAKRIIIFLTDGSPTTPLGPLDTTIQKGFDNLGAIFYAITAFNGMDPFLQRWADKTGGKAFVADGDDAGGKLLEIYRRIAAELQGKLQCYLEWTAPLSCDEGSRKRTVEVKLTKIPNPITSSASYTAPLSSILKYKITPSLLYFGDPAPNTPITQKVTIKANGKVTFSSGSIVPAGGTFSFDPNSAWKGDSPITLDSGDSITITVIFNQLDPKEYRQGALIIKGDPCDPPLISLVAGLAKVNLIAPGATFEDSLFSSCDDLIIQWGGVKPEDPVLLQYSADSGKTWQLLKENATGLSYVWTHEELQKLKLDTGKVYKVKVLIPSVKKYIWAKNGGGVANDSTYAISLTDDGLRFNICGEFQGTNAKFDNQQLNSNNGSMDGFIAQYNTSGGLIWVTPFGGATEDKALGVVCAPNDIAFVTGYYTGNANIGLTQRNPYDKAVKNYFLGKIASGGSIPFVYDGTRSRQNVTGESYGYEIAYEPADSKIYVHGKYKGKMSDENNPTTHFLPQTGANFEEFTAIHDINGALIALQKGKNEQNHKYTTMSAIDKDGCIYETKNFKDPITDRGSQTITSNGGTDFLISQFCGLPASEDASSFTFILGKPRMVSTDAVALQFPVKVAVGNAISEKITTNLCNYGTLNSTLEKVEFSNPAEFSTGSNLVGKEFIVPNCFPVPIELIFAPKTLEPNPHCTDITFFFTCSEPVKITVCAEATDSCHFTKKDVDFPPTLEGSSMDSIVTAIYCNNSLLSIDGKFTMTGSNPEDFEIISVTDDKGIEIYKEPIPNLKDTSFTIGANGCLTVKLRFKPHGAGNRSAFLNFNIPADCGEAKSILNGIGLSELALEVSPQSWPCTRPGQKSQQTVKVKNIGTSKATITSLNLQPPGAYTIVGPQPPIDLDADSSVLITIEFNPPAVRTYTTSFEVNATSSSGTKKFSSTLTGEGCLPVDSLEVRCFPLTALGSLSSRNDAIIVKNTGNADLKVDSIVVIPDETEFGSFSPTNFTVPANGGIQQITGTFTPKFANNRTAQVVIYSNGVPGRDTVIVCGNAFAADSTIDFDTVLICDNPTATATYSNSLSTSTDIDVSSNSSYFLVEPSGMVTVAPGETKKFKVTFQPDKAGLFPGAIKIGPKSFQVQGVGTLAPINFYVTPDSSSITRLSPGEIANITVKADILGNLGNSILDTMKIAFVFPSKLFSLTQTNPVIPSLLANWTWNSSVTKSGNQTTVTVVGNGPSLKVAEKNKDLFVLQLNSYLGDTTIYPVAVTGSVNARLANCVPITNRGTRFDMENICFKAGRLISSSDTYYQLKSPKPSPATNEAKFEYGIGLSGNTEIMLYNSLGEQVQTLVNEYQAVGTYEITLNVAPLPPGVYFYILRSGPYMEQQRLFIAK